MCGFRCPVASVTALPMDNITVDIIRVVVAFRSHLIHVLYLDFLRDRNLLTTSLRTTIWLLRDNFQNREIMEGCMPYETAIFVIDCPVLMYLKAVKIFNSSSESQRNVSGVKLNV